jgi:putative DNA primase/helicase
VQTGREAALSYVTRGWSVIPVHGIVGGKCTCGTMDCPNAGKHPCPGVHSYKDGTKDPVIIERWWSQWPWANPAVVTGRVSGIYVVDIDPRHGGFASFEEWEASRAEGPLPTTRKVNTGGGGLHLYFAYPDDAPVPSRNNLLPGVDIKSDGGYVLAPPSSHLTGGTYQLAGTDRLAFSPGDLLWFIRNGGGGAGKALPRTEDILAGIPEGERDTTLFRFACRLMRRHDGDVQIVRALVLQAARNSNPPFPDEDAERKVIQAVKYYDEEKAASGSSESGSDWARRIGLSDNGEATQSEGGGLKVDQSLWPGIGDYTDRGLATRLAWLLEAHHKDGSRAKYSPALGWMRWAGDRWLADEGELDIWGDVGRIIPLLEAEKDLPGGDESSMRRLASTRQKTNTSAGTAAVVRMARTLPELRAPDVDSWDKDPWLFNCANGILDLRSGKLWPHNRRALMTKRSAVPYEEEASLPFTWLQMLEWIVPDATKRDWLQKAIGYSLTGDTSAKAFFILTGTGNNGKSTLLETLADIAGDYAAVAAKAVFIKRFQDSHPEHIARLRGSRFVRASEEVGPNDSLNTELLKTLTGGEKVQARFMHQGSFEFSWTGKLWLATNHIPKVNEWGAALETRTRILGLEPIPKSEQRPSYLVRQALLAEAPGVLRWCVEGARQVYEQGVTKALLGTAGMREDAQDAFGDQDIFRMWVERWRYDPEARVFAGDLWNDFQMWMATRQIALEDAGAKNSVTFGKRLKAYIPKDAYLGKISANGVKGNGYALGRVTD